MHLQKVFLTGKRVQEQIANGYNTTESVSSLLDALHEEQNAPHTFPRNMVVIDEHIIGNPIYEPFITESGTLDWTLLSRERMCTTTPELQSDDEAAFYNHDIPIFPEASRYIRRAIFHVIHPYAQSIFLSTPEDIVHKYAEKMCHLPTLMVRPNITEFNTYINEHNGLFLELVSLYRRGLYQLCFTMGVSFLERAISDLLHSKGWVWESTKHIKFNDLLSAPTMRELFGPDMVFVLRLLVGPTQGMSIRNMVWHGAFGDGEFPSCYASMLLLIIVSLPHDSTNSLVSLAEFDVPISVPDLDMETIINSSYFVPINQRKTWIDALTLYRNGEPFYAAVMFFPLLEYAIRRLFVQCNDRFDLETTESIVGGFVTFEDSLSPHLGYGQGRNKLFNELDESIIQAIHDMLVWTYGPQVRIRISHGIVDPRTVPRSIFVMLLPNFSEYC
jgi:hypothetical protein